jgi:hypothetical protein
MTELLQNLNSSFRSIRTDSTAKEIEELQKKIKDHEKSCMI